MNIIKYLNYRKTKIDIIIITKPQDPIYHYILLKYI